MPNVATTDPSDVRLAIETDMPDTDPNGPSIDDYLDEAESEAFRYNDVTDFDEGELDDLVKFYAALMIDQRSRQGGELKSFQQGSRRASLTTSDDGDGQGWLRSRVRANDPSGQILGGRRSNRHFAFASGKADYGEEEGDYGYDPFDSHSDREDER